MDPYPLLAHPTEIESSQPIVLGLVAEWTRWHGWKFAQSNHKLTPEIRIRFGTQARAQDLLVLHVAPVQLQLASEFLWAREIQFAGSLDSEHGALRFVGWGKLEACNPDHHLSSPVVN